MPSIHELAHRHFDELRGELKSVDVPELGPDVKIYFYSRFQAREVVDVIPFIDMDDLANSDYRAVLKLFFFAARDEKGARLFSAVNEHEIAEKWDFKLVNDLVNRMGLLDNLFGNELDAEAKKG